jgi:hypothetical protein
MKWPRLAHQEDLKVASSAQDCSLLPRSRRPAPRPPVTCVRKWRRPAGFFIHPNATSICMNGQFAEDFLKGPGFPDESLQSCSLPPKVRTHTSSGCVLMLGPAFTASPRALGVLDCLSGPPKPKESRKRPRSPGTAGSFPVRQGEREFLVFFCGSRYTWSKLCGAGARHSSHPVSQGERELLASFPGTPALPSTRPGVASGIPPLRGESWASGLFCPGALTPPSSASSSPGSSISRQICSLSGRAYAGQGENPVDELRKLCDEHADVTEVSNEAAEKMMAQSFAPRSS